MTPVALAWLGIGALFLVLAQAAPADQAVRDLWRSARAARLAGFRDPIRLAPRQERPTTARLTWSSSCPVRASTLISPVTAAGPPPASNG
jgi:hypothetical protein